MRSLCCMGAPVDVVVVSYNSRDKLRACVQPLCELSDVHVIVVDNDSPDRSLETIADLPVLGLQQSEKLEASPEAPTRAGEPDLPGTCCS